ncbi:MAG: DUF1844 domain-containing protein [Acidobacteriota bacterium]
MASEEQRDERSELRVTDRRRFTETGEERSGFEEEASAPAEPEPAPETAAPPPSADARPEPPPPEPAASEPEPSATVDERGELDGSGIEAVFMAFGQSALLNLGFPDPMGQRAPVNLEAAQDAIRLLQVLQEKTAGNLDAREAAMLGEMLHQVQLAFVEVTGALNDASGKA